MFEGPIFFEEVVVRDLTRLILSGALDNRRHPVAVSIPQRWLAGVHLEFRGEDRWSWPCSTQRRAVF
jgi:hypothetical protein